MAETREPNPAVPEEAVQAAAEALARRDFSDKSFEGYARAALEAAAPVLAAQARADERRSIVEGFRALVGKCKAIPDKGLNLGQIWQRDEQAREYDRIADMIEKGTARESR